MVKRRIVTTSFCPFLTFFSSLGQQNTFENTHVLLNCLYIYIYVVLRSMGVLQLFGVYRIRKDIRIISFVGVLKEKKTSVKSSIFTTVNVNVLFDSI